MSAVWQSHRGFIHESKVKENAKCSSSSGPIIHAGFSKGRSKVGVRSSKLGLSSNQHRPEGFPRTFNPVDKRGSFGWHVIERGNYTRSQSSTHEPVQKPVIFLREGAARWASGQPALA
ncbi:hypothetical protein PAAG_12638 [Paracoccidioides lutzii Pb01]|uniref:Uncharacterized protein n=1 Tax=Paracoccidioides lutzii (strain ATCC MYA-826 / Pb01) TaxID=502779 RepID=A0A0A2V3L1_PARBA|nr:hypothetical protein PAAG_12638 [Paracoccidioides lutzii Pb01]KGQ00705.1 hypothetical protein PAAG_12638 [Paracoccidioides lutzii Pb01]